MSEKMKAKIQCDGLKNVARDLEKAENVPLFFGSYGPEWFQELSDRQMAAADEISMSISEDIEQGTVHRCQRFLRGIGIKPIVKPSDIMLALHLCKINDMAFLWYLMKMFYTTPQTNSCKNGQKSKFSVNERLFLSSIAHLDMICTLRELDKQCRRRKVSPKALPKTPRLPRKRHYISPYLEPLPRPKFPESHSLPMPTLPGPNFQPYDVYKNTEYMVVNEPTRWFARNWLGIVPEPDPNSCNCICDPNCPENILNSMLPIAANEKTIPVEFYEKLMSEFQAATKCHCGDNHPLEMCKKPLHVSQLDAARTPAEFRELLAAYKVQVMVHSLVKCLLFEPIPNLNNILMCINCKKCIHDFDRLEFFMTQNCDRPSAQSPYDTRIRQYLFGSRGPVGLLRRFNDLADHKAICLDICVKDVWMYEVQLWCDNVDDGVALAPLDDREKAAPVDPNDVKTINRELFSVLREMRQRDPKFVLACLPEAHKLPLLSMWMRVRYGLKFSRKDRSNQLLTSFKRWIYLDRRKHLQVRVPEPQDVCRRTHGLDFGQKEELESCIHKLRDEYYHRLSVALINDARRLWPTMEPYYVTSGPPRKLFYAYLAGCEYDITPFRPWAIYEAKNMVLWTQNKADSC